MTVIAARKYEDKVELVCESRVGDGDLYTDNQYPSKIYVGNNYCAGGAGPVRLWVMAIEYFKRNSSIGNIMDWCRELKSVLIDDVDENNILSLILVHDGRIYEVIKFVPIPIKEMVAIGSGYIVAEGIMSLGYSAELGVKGACNVLHECGGEIKVYNIPILEQGE